MSESWYLVESGSSQGPLDAAAMAAKAADGSLRAETQVCRVGAQAWSRADTDEALRPLFAASAELAPPAQEWSIALGFRMVKAWKGPSWGAMVLIGLVWFVLLLPSNVLDVIEESMKCDPGTPGWDDYNALQLLSIVVSLMTAALVSVPAQASIAVLGASAIAGNLRVSHMFMAYRRYFGVLGATLLYGVGMSLGYFGVVLIGGMIAGLLLPITQGNVGLLVAGSVIGIVALVVFLSWFIRRAVRYSFGVAIVCDPANRSVGVFEAFRRSAQALKGREGSVFGFLLLVALLALLTTLLLGIGLLLIGWPMFLCAYGAVYHVLVRRQPPPQPGASAGT